MEEQHNQWQGQTYGSGTMHRMLIALLKCIDVRVIYVIAYIFIVPVTMVASPNFRHIYRFFRIRRRSSCWSSFWQAFRNHCLFSEVIIDRFAMYAGKHFDVKIEGYEHFQRLASQPQGFVQLSAHVGNYELAGYSLVSDRKGFNVLLYGGEKSSVMSNRERMFEHANIRMIPLSRDMSHVFAIDQAISNGEVLSIAGDRTVGDAKTITMSFLGADAHFPQGPFVTATVRQLEVLEVSVIKTSWKGYTIYVTPLKYDTKAVRSQQIEQLAHSYRDELERIVNRFPTQWYNFFDFWKQ